MAGSPGTCPSSILGSGPARTCMVDSPGLGQGLDQVFFRYSAMSLMEEVTGQGIVGGLLAPFPRNVHLLRIKTSVRELERKIEHLPLNPNVQLFHNCYYRF